MFKVHTFPMDVSVTLDSNLQEYKDFALLFNLPYKLFLFQFSSGGFWKDLPVVSQKKRHPWPHASMALSLELLQTQLAAATAKIDALETAMTDNHPEEGLDTGDTAFILICTCLVLMMTIPGLALFYAGMSRAQNVLSTVMQSFAITCWVSLLWLMFGYSLAFREGNDFIGGGDGFWFRGDDKTGKPILPETLSGTIPEALFCIFQLTFAVITCAIITGSVAERMKFSALLVFMFFWHLLIYCPIAHWEWGGGFMGNWGVLDFAGGDVVHISSGVSGLVAAIILGPRRAFGAGAELPPHNVLLTFLGASLLWVGWFGFNAGSALGANGSASMAMLVTHISASAAGISWMFTEWALKGKPSVLGIVSGAIAGLVVITPGAGYVDQTGGFVMGIIGGVVCYFGIQIKHACGFDDALDAFGVHGVGGIVGGILTGCFANPAISDASGLFYGNAEQLGWQIAGILVVTLYSAVGTAIILLALKFTMGIRVSETDEDVGLDISEHGEALYGEAAKTIEMPAASISRPPAPLPAPAPQFIPQFQPYGQPYMMGPQY
jgi:Amt family ammonium transporter